MKWKILCSFWQGDDRTELLTGTEGLGCLKKRPCGQQSHMVSFLGILHFLCHAVNPRIWPTGNKCYLTYFTSSILIKLLTYGRLPERTSS